MIEQWKSIPDYTSNPIYQVSTLGRVKRITRNGVHILKPFSKHDYLYIGLCKNGKQKHFRLNRLVAEAFIPNPDNLPTVNHKDENKLNNNVYNLEWSTVKDNDNFGTRNIRMANSKKKSPITQYDMTGKIVTIYPGIKDAQIITGINRNCIREVCKGTRKSAGGYKWSYYKEIQNE